MKHCGQCPVCTGMHDMFHDRPKECDREVGERFKASLADMFAVLCEASRPTRWTRAGR